jgi:prepilin-type processing-associated H-X9-DG protein
MTNDFTPGGDSGCEAQQWGVSAPNRHKSPWRNSSTESPTKRRPEPRTISVSSSQADFNDDTVWNFTSSYRVIGYVLAFEGAPRVLSSNLNEQISPTPIRMFRSTESYLPSPTERELAVDATLSLGTNNFANILGGWWLQGRLKPNRTSHLHGQRPAGGNIVFLDGHVGWRPFPKMTIRTTGQPAFWW